MPQASSTGASVTSAAAPQRLQRGYALRRQVAQLLLGAVLAPTLLIAVVQTVYEYDRVQQQQQDRLRLAVRLTATSIDQFVETHAAAVALAAAEASKHGDPPDLEGLHTLFPAFVTVLATDASGRITAAGPPDRAAGAVGQSTADRDYFQVAARELRPYVSNAFQGRGLGNEPLVAVSAPMRTAGRFSGIVEGSIRVDAFTRLRSSALRMRGQEMLVVDRAGHVIHASAGLPFHFRQDVSRAPILAQPEKADGVSAATIDSTSMPGRSSWVAASQLHSGWRVLLFEPRDAALGAVWRHAGQTAAVLLLASLLVMLVAHALIRRVADAVGTTLETLRAIAAGERAPATPMVEMPAELKPVAHQVVQLAQELQDANAGLRDALAGQQALSRHLADVNDSLEQTVRARTAELEVANRDLERLSQTDPLTGALNVRGLGERYATLTDAHGRLRAPLAVVIFDVDFFKRYNDHYGHPAGDNVLRRVASTAQGSLRGDPDRVARIGGEEFLVLLPDSDIDTARHIAERIRADVHALGIPNVEGCDSRVTISLGVALGARGELIDSLVRQADEALYRAKGAGRNCVRD